MATLYLYEKNGLKRGNPITFITSIELVTWPNNGKSQVYVPLVTNRQGGGPDGNIFSVFLPLEGGTTAGTIRIIAGQRGATEQISNSGSYEFLLA